MMGINLLNVEWGKIATGVLTAGFIASCGMAYRMGERVTQLEAADTELHSRVSRIEHGEGTVMSAESRQAFEQIAQSMNRFSTSLDGLRGELLKGQRDMMSIMAEVRRR